MLIDGYKTSAIQLFQIHSMNEFNFIPRVTLFNKSDKSEKYVSSYIIDVSHTINGMTKFVKNIGRIKPGESFYFDCKEMVRSEKNEECIINFHLIPEKFYGTDEVSITREELYFYLTCQDHYVEYYNASGFSSGVLYQSGPFNYKKFSAEASTIIQAPKVYSAKNVRTYMSFVNNSFADNYTTIAEVKCALVDSKGSIIKQWVEMIPPYTVKFVDLNFKEPTEKKLEAKGFYAVSKNVTLLPLTFTINSESGSLALEHSLPPMYYSPEVRGALRTQIVKELQSSSLFKELL